MPWRRGRGRVADRSPATAHGAVGADRPQRDAAAGRLPGRHRHRPAGARLPFLGAQWGSVDERVLPAGLAEPEAADLQAELRRRDVHARRSCRAARTRPALAAYVATCAQVDGVTDVQVVATKPSTGSRHAGGGDLAGQRPDREQPGRRQGPPRGRRPRRRHALVGGTDGRRRRPDRLDRRHAAVDGADRRVVMLVLLFLAFGSVVLPLKAIVMNAASRSRRRSAW